MEENKFNLPNNQLEAINNGEVFSKVAISMDESMGHFPKNMQDGVVFIATDIKLIAKDGSNDVLSAIGLQNFEDKIDQTNKCFRPTTFNELVIAFKHTGYKGLESFFRMGDENNMNINKLMCSFLNNNLESDQVDVKALASTSLEVKEIVSEKSEQFYQDKVDFFNRKIEKYQSRIESLRQEQYHVNEDGEQIVESEIHFSDAVESYVDSIDKNADASQSVEDVIKYFNFVKETSTNETETSNSQVEVNTQTVVEEAVQ